MIEDVRNDAMMAHLLDALENGDDIGHYGRLVFVMVARHFAQDDELVELLCRDPGVSEDEARALVEQVRAHDYSPPRREKILEYQRDQEFPIVPDAEDPDAGNVYRTLRFPDDVYEHIEQYREAKAHAHANH